MGAEEIVKLVQLQSGIGETPSQSPSSATHDVDYEDLSSIGVGGDYASYGDLDPFGGSLDFDLGLGQSADYNFGGGGSRSKKNRKKKEPVDCHYKTDGDYINQAQVAAGCHEYLTCWEGDTFIKACPPGMTYDWKV